MNHDSMLQHNHQVNGNLGVSKENIKYAGKKKIAGIKNRTNPTTRSFLNVATHNNIVQIQQHNSVIIGFKKELRFHFAIKGLI
ncbi:hypothetical protein T06_3968 [Trichinella sp. T6]|nr:hypothetical protein T06_3968 [Trichinella sp. T6]